jgi:hypothetical protein
VHEERYSIQQKKQSKRGEKRSRGEEVEPGGKEWSAGGCDTRGSNVTLAEKAGRARGVDYSGWGTTRFQEQHEKKKEKNTHLLNPNHLPAQLRPI